LIKAVRKISAKKRAKTFTAKKIYKFHRLSLYKSSHLILKMESFKVIIQKEVLLRFKRKIMLKKIKASHLIFQKFSVKRIKKI
jgi:hypothetical protein